MKIKFNSKIQYQIDAINSVVDLFDGIETKDSVFTLRNNQESLFENENIFGSNRIITNDWLNVVQENVVKIQKRNNIIVYEKVHLDKIKNSPIFDIEMETGTGKTYVFLRTILELNEKYNFKKFVIIVPSIAIKEGVKKTLDITKDHFKILYNKENYDYIEYDGVKSLEDIKDFGRDNNIKILIINIQSFNKIDNILNKESDIFGDILPIQFIKQTRPIVIIDEPQSTANTKKSIEAIENLNPLFILRYSATFRKRLNNEILLYKLSPIDAYNKKLVKEIIVHGHKSINITSNILAELLDVTNDNNEIRAKVKLKCIGKKEKDEIKFLKNKVDLYDVTKNDFFKNKNYIIDEITKDKDNESNSFIKFLNGKVLKKGKTINSENHIEKDVLKRNQIEKTIRLHLDKQLELYDKKIKVLSLFFIDNVHNYRYKENNDNSSKTMLGIYGKIFEEYFIQIANEKKYEKLFINKNINELVKKVHDGYFSIDSRNKEIDTKGKGENATSDTPTYIKIMREKEKLLSLDEELCFIFSHSALKEGWDNPNVFQICTLSDTKSEIKKRQEIGRGLRLCVNQNGERIYDSLINKLSIITNESYEEFVSNLQKEFEDDGIFSKDIPSFMSNNCRNISFEIQKEAFLYLKEEGFLNKKDNSIKKEYLYNLTERNKKIEKTIGNYKNLSFDIISNIICEYEKQVIKSKTYVKNGNEKEYARQNVEIINSEIFTKFLNTIEYKSIYKTKIDTDHLIKESVNEIKNSLNDNLENLMITNEEVTIDRIEYNKFHESNNKKTYKEVKNKEFNISLNEWIESIEKSTRITKKSIFKIIYELLRDNFLLNFLERDPFSVKKTIIEGINKIKNEIIVENITYEKTNGTFNLKQIIKDNGCKLCYYPSDFNDLNNIYPKSKKIDKGSDKTPFNIIELDSNNEENYLDDVLIPTENYKIFFKIPKSFYIQTPIGNYSPDWGIYNPSSSKQYFICETKGSNDEDQLRKKEEQKIKCARKHFECLDKNLIDFKVKTSRQ